MSYHDIAVKYGTDKATHGYMPYYEEHFNNLPEFIWDSMHLLEIGCKEGASLRMWREIHPKIKLTTIDLFEEYGAPTEIEGLKILKGSQSNGRILQVARELGPYDVIIDDGSHNSRDQLISFYGLLGCTYMYVVEDLHCCNDEFYRQGMAFEQTMLGQMKTNTFPFPFELYEDKIAFIYG